MKEIIQQALKIVIIIALLLSVGAVYAQQYNTDNYLTMPHGTGTFVLTTGERNASMYSTFTLLPRFELNFQSSLFWEDASIDFPQYFSLNIFGKYMFWVNEANTGGAAIFLGIGKSPGFYTKDGYSAFHKNYWTALPLTIPFFNNTISWDIQPGALVDFDYGNNKETAWGFTYSTRVAIYRVIPQTAIIAELYGTEGKAYSKPEYRVGIRWEPNSYIVPAISYGSCFDGSPGAGFELGIVIYSPQFLKKDFIKNNSIAY